MGGFNGVNLGNNVSIPAAPTATPTADAAESLGAQATTTEPNLGYAATLPDGHTVYVNAATLEALNASDAPAVSIDDAAELANCTFTIDNCLEPIPQGPLRDAKATLRDIFVQDQLKGYRAEAESLNIKVPQDDLSILRDPRFNDWMHGGTLQADPASVRSDEGMFRGFTVSFSGFLDLASAARTVPSAQPAGSGRPPDRNDRES